MHYVYVIQNKLNYKIYVGQTVNPKLRWCQHKSYVKNNNSLQYIHRAMFKYGINNFDFIILEQHLDQVDLDDAEEFWIGFFQSRNKTFGYNIAPGGNIAWNKGLAKELQPMYGKHHSKESSKKISNAQKGIPRNTHSEDTKKKMSISRTGLFRGENGPGSKLSKEDVSNIRILLAEGKSALSISRTYSVSDRAILNIKHGKSWK